MPPLQCFTCTTKAVHTQWQKMYWSKSMRKPGCKALIALTRYPCSETTSAYRDGLGQSIVGWTKDRVVRDKQFMVFNNDEWGLHNVYLREEFI